MIDNLPAYPAYRDSELPWIGAIPVHWDLLRNGRIFTHRVETGFPDLPILEVSLRTGVRVRDLVNLKRKQMMTQKEKYKRAVKGDIAYNMMRMWQGALGVAPVDGLVSPAYVVVRPFDGVNSAYYDYLFRTGAYMSEVNKYSRGIVSDRNRLYWDEFKQMPSIIPPRDEQDKIVAFLRTQDRQIARFIRDKRWLIELLNEQKQTIIHRAVTRGLDPDVRLRPSGIDWLGDVPEHWDVRAIKQVSTVYFSGVDKHTVAGEELVMLCNYTDVYKNECITSQINFMQASATKAEIAKFTLKRGDVLITKDSETADDIAVPAWVSENLSGVICGYHLALLRPVEGTLTGEYFYRALTANRIAQQFHVAATGVTRVGLSKHDVKNAVFPVPPTEEQGQICRWIEDKFIPLDDAISRSKSEIDLIREYRERLISDVVTGKVDVRGWTPAPEDLAADAEELTVIGDDEEIPAEEDGDAND